MKQVNGTALLVTIAEDLSNEPVLKVWALDKTEKKTGAPKCLSSLGVHNGRKQFPVGYWIGHAIDMDIELNRSRLLPLSKIYRNWPSVLLMDLSP